MAKHRLNRLKVNQKVRFRRKALAAFILGFQECARVPRENVIRLEQQEELQALLEAYVGRRKVYGKVVGFGSWHKRRKDGTLYYVQVQLDTGLTAYFNERDFKR